MGIRIFIFIFIFFFFDFLLALPLGLAARVFLVGSPFSDSSFDDDHLPGKTWEDWPYHEFEVIQSNHDQMICVQTKTQHWISWSPRSFDCLAWSNLICRQATTNAISRPNWVPRCCSCSWHRRRRRRSRWPDRGPIGRCCRGTIKNRGQVKCLRRGE